MPFLPQVAYQFLKIFWLCLNRCWTHVCLCCTSFQKSYRTSSQDKSIWVFFLVPANFFAELPFAFLQAHQYLDRQNHLGSCLRISNHFFSSYLESSNTSLMPQPRNRCHWEFFLFLTSIPPCFPSSLPPSSLLFSQLISLLPLYFSLSSLCWYDFILFYSHRNLGRLCFRFISELFSQYQIVSKWSLWEFSQVCDL